MTKEKEKKIRWIHLAVPVLYVFLLAAGCLYLSMRIRSWANLVIGRETGYLTGIVMTAYFIMSLAVSRKYLVAKTRLRTFFVGISTFIVMYLTISVLCCDAAGLILRCFTENPAVRERFFLWCGWLCILFTGTGVWYGMHQANTIRTVSYEVPCGNLAHPVKAVLLTDLHIGFYVGARHITKVVEAVNRLDADLVLISGDIINAARTGECPEIGRTAELLSQLRSREGTYAVTGNHDPDASDGEFLRFLEKAHIRLLEDRVYTNGVFHLVGRKTRCKARRTLGALMKGKRDLPVIVLDHDPVGIPEAVQEGADLILCGHTHKGQIFPMNLFVRLLYRKEEFWGYSRKGKTGIVVSSGCGYFSMPMRIGSDCEVVELDLIKAKA